MSSQPLKVISPLLLANSAVPLTYKGFCSLVRRVSPQGPPKPLPAFNEYPKSCISPNLSELELGTVNIGPPSSLDQLSIKIDQIPALGNHVTDSESEKWGMHFPGGENAGLSRLQRMVSGIATSPIGGQFRTLSIVSSIAAGGSATRLGLRLCQARNCSDRTAHFYDWIESLPASWLSLLTSSLVGHRRCNASGLKGVQDKANNAATSLTTWSDALARVLPPCSLCHSQI